MTSSSVKFEIDEDFIAGILVSVVCLVGMLLMGLVILGSYRIPSMKSPFGILTINQNLAEYVACLACLLAFFFGYTLNLEAVIRYSRFIGGVTIVMLHIILASFLLISLNRLCAILFPLAYKYIFDQKFLTALLVSNWLVPLICSLYLLVFRDCTFELYHYGWYFNEVQNENCGSSLLLYRVYPQLFLICSMLSADLLTLILLLVLRKRIFKLKSAETKRREMNFARQVLVQGFVFLMHGFWYENGRKWMPEMSENWKNFWTTSFSSNLLHVFDPAIVFICNIEFRTWLLKPRRTREIRKTISIGAVSTSMN